MNVIKAVLANSPAPRRHNSSRTKEMNTQYRNFQLALDGEPGIVDASVIGASQSTKLIFLLKYSGISIKLFTL